MLAAKRFGKPFLPILEHAIVHGVLMWLALVAFGVPQNVATALGMIQVLAHALIDWLKGRWTYCFALLQNPANYAYWYVFGLDQLAHILVILLMWSIAIRKMGL
jgi:hypothetical protein